MKGNLQVHILMAYLLLLQLTVPSQDYQLPARQQCGNAQEYQLRRMDGMAGLEHATNHRLDCERVDIPHPELDYPLNFLRKYLIGSFTTLFHPFVSEADHRYLDALTALTREDVQGAATLLQQLIESEPTYSYAYIQLGIIYLWQDRLDLSYQMFQKVSTICPCNEYLNVAMEKLALQWDKRGVRSRDCVDIYRTLVKCVPDSVAYQFGLGRALVHTGDLNEAEGVLKKCMEASPDDSDIGLQLADVYVLQQEYDKALGLYHSKKINS